MHHDFQRLMRDATQLTRGGNLSAATAAIQQALGNARSHERASSTQATAHANNPRGSNADIILDGLTRIIEDSDGVDVTPKEDARYSPSPAAEPTAVSPPASQTSADWIDGSYTHKGRTLKYKLFAPPQRPGLDAPTNRPLIVMLHGCTQGADDFATGTQMNALALNLGALVLYPEQSSRANPQKCWNWFKPQHQSRDRGEPAVIAALTHSIIKTHQADSARVYVAGLSAGGAMAAILGHEYPELYAAVGVHSGLPYGAASDVMSALTAMRSGDRVSGAGSHAPPTIVFHGDADQTVHVSNGQALASAACQQSGDGAKLTKQVFQGKSAQGQAFTRTVYSNVAGSGVSEYWQLHGAGHAWSGGGALGSYTNPNGVDASAEMLRFFLAHKSPPAAA